EAGPGEATVPEALLSTNDGEQQPGAPGTRCWGGMCVDMIGVIAPEEALIVSTDEAMTFTLTAGDPTSVHLRVLEWQPSDFEGSPGTVVIAPDAPVAASGDLATARTIEWQVPSEPGEYALALFTAYEQGGDIAYGWHIVVE
ncbi:MAG: hypothetical protein ACRDIB_04740, partial [Ardenticatenaceae bacterium]